MYLLSCRDVTKFFGGLAAIKNLYFEVYENEILGLIGPNGAGKTTLFNVVTGLYQPDHGEILYKEENITGLRQDLICKKGIARTFQIVRPFLNMNVLENAMVGSFFVTK